MSGHCLLGVGRARIQGAQLLTMMQRHCVTHSPRRPAITGREGSGTSLAGDENPRR